MTTTLNNLEDRVKYVVCSQQVSKMKQNLDFAVDSSLGIRNLRRLLQQNQYLTKSTERSRSTLIRNYKLHLVQLASLQQQSLHFLSNW